jgi:hypothetical protein
VKVISILLMLIGVAGALMSIWVGSTPLFLINTAVALFGAAIIPGRRK